MSDEAEAENVVERAWDRENWRVLFVVSPSPGAVFRFLERRALAGEKHPAPLYLSEPAPPHGYRLLYAPTASRVELAGAAARLSTAFPHGIFLLYRRGGDAPVWGHARWEAGQAGESAEAPLPRHTPWQRLAARLPGPASVSPPVAWATRSGLPLDHLPLVGRSAVPVVEYRTVSTLDQRSLLVENEPRVYRFEG